MAAGALALAGCGGGARQDAAEATATYTMQVAHPRFPAAQSIARQTSFVLPVRNTGTSTVPNVAVTIDSFDYTVELPRPRRRQAARCG